ncbi:MAG: hypothetical protein A2Z08_04910 [Deltaproteobacteria bacterium RBG_16_54_11]|nr:MAG: hypothetical protein A2Z08_04910 [Deltaproteobacteria bacterium RBG_16_54_11]
MARWRYKTSTHNLPAMVSESERVIQCDDKGHCLVHDLPEKNLAALEKILNAEGDKGWELIQCHYHVGELLCLWKREEEGAKKS